MLENSKVILSKNIKVDREMKNVLSYSPSQLINLMTDNTHLVASDDHCSFIRERGTLQIDIDYSRVLGSNYMAYQNSDYSNKWFFCWIDEVLYKGNNNTEIVFTVDPFETFYSDLDFENAYVIREHVNDDTIGLHTIPENLETGEPVQEGDTLDVVELRAMAEGDYWLAIETDAYPRGDSYVDPNNPQIAKFSGVTQYNKLYSGHKIIILKDQGDASKFISRMNKDDAIDFIHSLFIVPSGIFGANDLAYMFDYDGASGENKFEYYLVQISRTVSEIPLNVDKSYSFSGYNPKNNKCKVYPYNYMYISNNVGQSKILKYEDFSTSNCQMSVYGCLTIGGSFKLIPKNYKNIARNDDESIGLGKYPTCSWTGDAYTNWLSQQSVNLYAQSGTNIIQGAMQGAMVGGTHGALAMAGINLAGEVADWIGEEKEAKLSPNKGGGSNTGSVNWAIGANNFFIRRMHCKPEYLRIVDNYFTRFGYKINRLKTPNITGRRYFNYVQVGSSDDVASGSIPQKYMKEINDAFRKGITIWHDHSKIGDYSVSNTIVS